MTPENTIWDLVRLYPGNSGNVWMRTQVWVKFLARYFISGRHIRHVASMMSSPILKRALQDRPELLLKPVRPYMKRGLSPALRAEALLKHYMTAESLLRPEAFTEIHEGGMEILSHPTEAGLVTMVLGHQGQFYREAELNLELRLDGKPLMGLGISFADARTLRLGAPQTCLWIGILKAFDLDGQTLDQVRSLTKSLEGLRPKALLLMAAQALAQEYALEAIYAASNEGLVFASYAGLKKRVQADYNEFWTECDGEQITEFAFRLPLEKPQRDPMSYKANKRSQIRRRQTLENELTARMREHLAALKA